MTIKVAVVDDQEIVRAGFAALLGTQQDFRVVGTAADGEEAVELCRTKRPHVVLMDVRMPKMDGIRATQALHAQQPGIPVVLWSGESEVGGAAAVAGADAGLCKGTCTSDLVATLRRICAVG